MSESGGRAPVYLDHAATTPVRAEAAAAMREWVDRVGNPSSLHRYGRAARAALDRARDTIAEGIGGRSSEIIFTGGGTESDNLAVIGGARARPDRRHVLVSAIEHHAVIHAAQALEAEGFDVEYLPVDPFGQVDPQEVGRRLRPETAVVSVMAANNELGTLEPIAGIAPLCRQSGAWFHTDAVQAFGHIPVDVTAWGIDLLSLSAHKFGGPTGAGALWVREGVELRPTLFGGAQERGRRGGTENTPAIVGMEAAIRAADFVAEAEQARELTSRLRQQLGEIPETWFNTPESGALPNILNVGFEGLRAETLLLAFDLEGLAASSGSACASGSLEPSHVLQAIGLPPDRAASCIRFSLGWTTTAPEIDQAVEIVERVVERARRRRWGGQERWGSREVE